MSSADQNIREVIEARGWISGSALENRFALALHRLGVRPGELVQQQSVGRYRLDFADPEIFIAIEADGFFHQMPGATEHDNSRDAWLLDHGWFTFRVRDRGSERDLQLSLVPIVQLIREERSHQGLPAKRHQTDRRQGKPSRLAWASGYRPPSEAA